MLISLHYRFSDFSLIMHFLSCIHQKYQVFAFLLTLIMKFFAFVHFFVNNLQSNATSFIKHLAFLRKLL